MPRKSLNIGNINVPTRYFVDFFRGVIDGDGGIQHWIHNTNQHEQWNLRITSGSKKFLEWLQKETEGLLGVRGGLYSQSERNHRLKYGKIAARVIAENCYYEGAFALKRKMVLAKACINSDRGWSTSKTVIDKGQVVEWNTRLT